VGLGRKGSKCREEGDRVFGQFPITLVSGADVLFYPYCQINDSIQGEDTHRNNGIGECFGEGMGGSIQLICLEPVAG